MFDIALSFFENLSPELISAPLMFLKAEGYWGEGPSHPRESNKEQELQNEVDRLESRLSDSILKASDAERRLKEAQQEHDIFDVRTIAKKAKTLVGANHGDLVEWGSAASHFCSDKRENLTDHYIDNYAWISHTKTRDTVNAIRETLNPTLWATISKTLKDIFGPANGEGSVLRQQLILARQQVADLTQALEEDVNTARDIVSFAESAKSDMEGYQAAIEYYHHQMQNQRDGIIEVDTKRLEGADDVALESARDTIESLIKNKLAGLELTIEFCEHNIKTCDFAITENNLHILDLEKLKDERLKQFDEWLERALELETEMRGSGIRTNMQDIQKSLEDIRFGMSEIEQIHDQRTSYEKILWVDWNPVPAIEHHRVLSLPAPEEREFVSE